MEANTQEEVVQKLQKLKEAKQPPATVIDYLNGLYTTKSGRLSIVVMPYFQGQSKHYINRSIEALEKIADNLAKIAAK